MKNNKIQINLNLKQKIILTNLLILAPIIIFIFIITYNALSKNLINNSIEYLLDKSRTTESYILNLLSSNDSGDKEDIIREKEKNSLHFYMILPQMKSHYLVQI